MGGGVTYYSGFIVEDVCERRVEEEGVMCVFVPREGCELQW